MEGVKQQILLLVNGKLNTDRNRIGIDNFKQWCSLLKPSGVQIQTEEEERLEKLLNKKKDVEKQFRNFQNYFEEIYELLWIILNSVTMENVGYFFHDLVTFYWNSLDEKYKQDKLELEDYLSEESYDHIVKNVWPYVMIDRALSELVKNKEEVFRIILKKLDEFLKQPELLPEDFYRMVEKHVGNKNFKLLNYKLDFLKDSEGFLGSYIKISINYSYTNENKFLRLFSKSVPPTGFLRPAALDTFKKEDFFYNEFLPRLNKLGFHHLDNRIPKCYFKRKNDIIVLEDVSFQGYSSLNIHDYASLEEALLMVKTIASLHAASIVFEEKMSEKLGKTYRIDDQYYDFIQETCCNCVKLPGVWSTCGSRHILEFFLDKFRDLKKGISMRILKRRAEYLLRQMFVLVGKSSTYRNVISHGDLWCTNYLYKYNENGVPISSLLIDFQLIRYAPPALDLVFFIYLNMSQENRKKYTADIVNEYYQELGNILSCYDINIKSIYNFENFWESFLFYKPVGLCIATNYCQSIIFPFDVFRGIKTDQQKFMEFFFINRSELLEKGMTVPHYNERIKGLMEDFIEYCESLTYP